MTYDAGGQLQDAAAELADWRQLPPGQRRAWWERLWLSVIALSDRYRLTLRGGWWEDSIQVEALAAFTCWLRIFDSGASPDAAAKLQLLWELERLRVVLRAGERTFDPVSDRSEFERHLARVQRGGDVDGSVDRDVPASRRARQLKDELTAVTDRIRELAERERMLVAGDAARRDDQDAAQARRDLHELRRAMSELRARQRELRYRLEDAGDG